MSFHRTTGGVLSVLSLIEGPFYCLSWQAEVFSDRKSARKFMFFGFFLSVFYESDSRNSRADWERLISTDCIPLASCSFMPSWSGFRPAEANRFRDTMWMIFHFLSRNFCRWTWRQSRSVRFRVLVLSIIINRQATPELGRGNEWDHTFFNRWLADERPLCLTKAFLLRFINESIPILFREKFAKERKYKRRT